MLNYIILNQLELKGNFLGGWGVQVFGGGLVGGLIIWE